MKTKLPFLFLLLLVLATALSSCADTGFYRKDVSFKQRILEAPPWWDAAAGNPLDRVYDLKDAETLHEENIESITGFPYVKPQRK